MGNGDVDAMAGVAAKESRITEDADTVGGAARIEGTRVRVSDIVIARDYHDLSPREIADEYSLAIPDVYAALSYFEEHTQDIRAEIRERERTLGSDG